MSTGSIGRASNGDTTLEMRHMMALSKHGRLAGIATIAAVTVAWAISPAVAASSARSGQDSGTPLACANLPIASGTDSGTGGQHARTLPQNMLPAGVLAVSAQSSRNAWAIGSPPPSVRPEKGIATHWNGTAWTTLSPARLPRLSGFDAVAAFSNGAWAAGQSGLEDHGDGGGQPVHLLVRLTGTTMQQVPVPGPADGELDAVTATSAANAWAAGDIGGVSGGTPLIVHWNGKAWKRSPLPATKGTGASSSSISGIDATYASNAWAVGNLGLILHWNGRQWHQVASPNLGSRYSLSSVATTSPKNVWAVGGLLDSNVVVILHWNGQQWSCAISPKVPFTFLASVSASSATNAWAVGATDGQALALHWGGHAWTQVTTPQPDPGSNFLDDVTFVPHSQAVWAVDSVGGTTTPTVLLRWDGAAWH